MDVILLENVEGLGDRGDRVQVARGYARNFLVPKRLALAATGAGARMFEEHERSRRKRSEKDLRTAEKLAKQLGELAVTITAQVGEDEKLFGSVTTQDIAEAVREKGFEIDKRQVMLEEPLKVLGVYRVDVKLYQDVSATLKVWVAKQEQPE